MKCDALPAEIEKRIRALLHRLALSTSFSAMAHPSALAGASSDAALADWQYTRWGMSPEQVVQASRGKATPVPPEAVARELKHLHTPDPIALLKSSVTVSSSTFGTVIFDVLFLFKAPERSLVKILLVKDNCKDTEYYDLKYQLSLKYAHPFETVPDFYGFYKSATWRTAPDGDVVLLSWSKMGRVPDCQITYERMPSGL